MQPVETLPILSEVARPVNHVARVFRKAVILDAIARKPFPEHFAVPGDFEDVIVFETLIGYLRLDDVLVRKDQRAPARRGGQGSGGVVTDRAALALPVVMLPRGPHRLAVLRLHLLGAIEPPHLVAVPIQLNERDVFLMRPAGDGASHDVPAGQHSGRETQHLGPALDEVAVHVDEHGAARVGRVVNRVSIPRFLGIVNGRTGRVDGRSRVGLAQKN